MGQIKYGVTGGVNRSTFIVSELTNYYITGFDVGAVAELSISDHFYLSPQLEVAMLPLTVAIVIPTAAISVVKVETALLKS